MSVSRKLFLAMASLVIAMGLIFIAITLTVVWGIMQVLLPYADRGVEMGELSSTFRHYYAARQSWEGVEELTRDWEQTLNHREVNVRLLSADKTLVYAFGDENEEHVFRLGIRQKLEDNQRIIGYLYYTDRELANQSKMKYGISSSVVFLLLASAILLVPIALLVAYRFAQRLTAPLKELLPVIDRLGKGEFGVQVAVKSKDEYGRVALAFNEMSSQLQRAEELRRNLVADVAHELRTPITIISGKLDLIQQSGQAIEPASLLPLQDELIRLTRLINDLHLLSLAEAKKLPMERKPTPIVALLEKVLERVALDAEKKEQTIDLHYPYDSIIVLVDPHRITQVLLNLLVNAVRYTPNGGEIDVSVAAEERGSGVDEGRFLRITVTDTGIGIAPEHLPFLFNRFFRTDEARTRDSGGTGLGLAIAKELVTAHGGTLQVESELGRGTSFIIRCLCEFAG